MPSGLARRQPTPPGVRTYCAVLAAGSLALAVAAGAYAHSRALPRGIALPLAFAFLTEYPFYLLLGFAEMRDALAARFSRRVLALAIVGSALLPYLVYSVPTACFHLVPAIAWLVIVTAVAGWFLPENLSRSAAPFRDIAFLILLAGAILSGILRWIFPAPVPRLPLDVLGHVILVRGAILAMLFLRGVRGTRIGFIPRWRDLWIGMVWFLACATVALPLGGKLGQLHLSARSPGLWQSAGLLLGVFWVLALSEEFFFRGLLQSWLSRWTGSKASGLVIGSLLFAACHLGFRGFPNWRFATLSAILGLCCGAAFLQARSIRASMVTHALAVGAWRLFLS